MRNADGSLISPLTYNIQPPTEARLETFISFTNNDGSAVTLFTAAEMENLDHTTMSSSVFLRAKEAFEVYTEGVVAQDNFEVMETALQAQFETTFVGSTTRVVAAESCFSASYG